MAMTWYDCGPVAAPGIAKAGGTGPPADTYYYIIIPYVKDNPAISPDFTFYTYKPQYFGKRCAEQSITVNGSEEVQLSWTKDVDADGYYVMRTTVSGNYNYATRDRWWEVGDVASFTDNNQVGWTYNYNIDVNMHGCYVIDSQYWIMPLANDCIDVQGEDAFIRHFEETEFSTDFMNGTTSPGWGISQYCNVHIHSGGNLLGDYYNAWTECHLWIMFGRIYVNDGGACGMQPPRASPNTGTLIFLYPRCNAFYPVINVAEGGQLTLKSMVIGQINSHGFSNYVDDTWYGDVEATSCVLSNIRTIALSNNNADYDLRDMTYSDSYYQFRLAMSSGGSGSVYLEDINFVRAGRVIFMYGDATFEIRGLNYRDWTTYYADEDAWFYSSSPSNSFTGTIVAVNPTWKYGNSTPNVIVTDRGKHHSGSFTVKYSFDCKVVDIDGDPIVGATVAIYDKDMNLLNSDTTDGSGNITQQDVIHQVYTCDEFNNNAIIITNKYPHHIIISKTGYNSLEYDLTIDRETAMTVPLSTVTNEGLTVVADTTDIQATILLSNEIEVVVDGDSLQLDVEVE